MNFSASVIREQITSILSAWKMKPELIEITAEIMTDTDLAGIDSHGISMLTWYEGKVLNGTLQLQVDPRVIRDHAATALIDAGGGLGHPAAAMAARMAADKAAVYGVGSLRSRGPSSGIAEISGHAFWRRRLPESWCSKT